MIGFHDTLKLEDRACPDCGLPRIVGHDQEGNDAWCCVGFDCPPEKVAIAGVLTDDGGNRKTRQFYVEGQRLGDLLAPFEGKRVLVTLSVYGEPPKDPT